MPEKPLWRDASGRLTFSVDGAEACRRMADRFSLTPDGEPLAGPARVARSEALRRPWFCELQGLTILELSMSQVWDALRVTTVQKVENPHPLSVPFSWGERDTEHDEVWKQSGMEGSGR